MYNSMSNYLIKSIGYFIILFLFCEYFVYYVVLRSCDWPVLNDKNADHTIDDHGEQPVRVMILADTHLLGSRKGHWLDKLRREWQMHRAFQTAMSLHKPELVFVLGDLTDEGLWCSETEFQYYVKRFHSLFAVPPETKMYVVVGNHDIGFHYGISPYLNQRFVSAFNSPAVQLISIRGNHFVLVNSMALEGDGCFLCKPAEQQLAKIESRLKCTKGTGRCGASVSKLDIYSKPILMQHYPLYRQSDAHCTGDDAAPFAIKSQLFKERWDCLSQEASQQLLDMLKPRLAFAGHTHHGCQRELPNNGREYTVPSFSWRNKNNPNYLLAVISPNNHAIYKCEMPQESTVHTVYIMGVLLLALYMAYQYKKLPKKPGRRMFKHH